MTMRRETLPTGKHEDGKMVLSSPYDPEHEITCTPYGEMSDGTMVWEDKSGKQYTRNKFYGKYYFIEI